MNEIKFSITNLKAEGADYKGVLPKEFMLLPEHDLIQLTSDIEYSFHVSEIIGGILITGTIELDYESNCGRCLEDYDEFVDQRFDIFIETPETNEIDITDKMREEIALILPSHSICSEDCQGLCVACGKNLNKEECECNIEVEEESPWANLDKLDLDGDK